ncbi:MAG: hypothetical protein E7166_05115 [Firmicutes bacterium]|nr:hypothetical protein [Bacillota bacterium]
MEKRKIPMKNYIIYGFIVIVTLVAVFYTNEWYKAYKISELENSYISKYVTEINYDEFENYILENPNVIIYISKTNSEASINIEKQLYKIIKDNELTDEIVFLNLTGNENVLDNIEKKYYKTNLLNNLDRIPAIAVFNDMKIVDILVSDEDYKISKSDILKFLEGHEYIK